MRETQRFFPCNSPVVVRCSRLGLGLQQRGYNRVEATGGRQVQRCACSKCHTNTLVQASLRQLYSNLQPRSSRALTLESGRRARTKGRLPEEGFGGWGLGVDLSAHCVEHHCAMRLLQVKHDVAHDVLQHMPQQARGGRHAACGGVRRRQAAANVLERAVPLDELELDGGAVGEARLQDARAVLFHGRHVPECKSMGGV